MKVTKHETVTCTIELSKEEARALTTFLDANGSSWVTEVRRDVASKFPGSNGVYDLAQELVKIFPDYSS